MKNSIDFIGGDTRRSLLRMVGPLLAAMVLTMAYNLVDSLWVGNLMGETGYAALTSSTSVVLILSAIAMGSSNGAAILIAQTAGAKKEAGGLISVSLALAGAFSVGVTAVLELALRPLLSAMNTPPELFSMAYDYLSVYLLGYAVIFLYMHFTAAFRAFGDPVFQMKGMLLSTVFNAVADPLMIRGFGLRGAAWATVLSEALCLVFAVVYHRKKRLFRLTLRRADAAWVRRRPDGPGPGLSALCPAAGNGLHGGPLRRGDSVRGAAVPAVRGQRGHRRHCAGLLPRRQRGLRSLYGHQLLPR